MMMMPNAGGGWPQGVPPPSAAPPGPWGAYPSAYYQNQQMQQMQQQQQPPQPEAPDAFSGLVNLSAHLPQ